MDPILHNGAHNGGGAGSSTAADHSFGSPQLPFESDTHFVSNVASGYLNTDTNILGSIGIQSSNGNTGSTPWVQTLNAYAASGLAMFADIGRPFQANSGSTNVPAASNAITGVQLLESVAESVAESAAERNELPPRIGSSVSLSALNALFGAASVLGEFSAEYDAGSNTYPKTIKRAAIGVLQGAGNTLIGAAVGTAAATAGLAAAPAILIGGAAALSVGYLSNQAINYFYAA